MKQDAKYSATVVLQGSFMSRMFQLGTQLQHADEAQKLTSEGRHGLPAWLEPLAKLTPLEALAEVRR